MKTSIAKQLGRGEGGLAVADQDVLLQKVSHLFIRVCRFIVAVDMTLQKNSNISILADNLISGELL